ncbi:putative racemase [compost metagenome]
MGKGIIKEETKQRYISIINNLIKQGAEGIILGCTEIPLIIKQNDVSVKVFDTTLIHSAAAVEFILSY